MDKVYLLGEFLGYDGYYGPVEQVIAAFGSREAAEAGLEQKRIDKKESQRRWIQEKYDGGETYPAVWGGKEGATRSIEEAGENLFVKEVAFSE